MPKQAVKVELFYDGVWNDLVATDDVLAQSITLQHGDGDESAAPRPQTAVLRLENSDDKFRTSNPVSPLYGKAGVNTPLRVSVGTAERGHVAASSWSADQTDDFRQSPARGSAWVDVQGGGLLQQINQWSEPLESAFRYYNRTIAGLAGYWPGEDPRGTTAPVGLVDGTTSFVLAQNFDSQKKPPGGGPAIDVQLQDIGSYGFKQGSATSTAGWQFSVAMYLTPPSLFTSVINVTLWNGWEVFLNLDGSVPGGQTSMYVSDNNQNTVASNTVGWNGYTWNGRWILMVLDCSYSGGTSTVQASWSAVDEEPWWTFSVSFAGVTSDLRWSDCSGFPDGSAYGHVIGTQGRASSLTHSDRWDAFLGHAGEVAALRFARLCGQRNIAYLVSPNWALSAPMGPQPAGATLAQQFRQIRDTDDALLFDLIDGLTLYFMARADRYNQTPKLALDAAANPTGLVGLPAETTDDLPIHNIVTLSNIGGGDFTLEDSTSSMGTQDPPNGRGEYRQKIDASVADESGQLPPLTNWYLNRGTVPNPRFPQVTVDLNALDATKITEVESARVGNVITIANYREYLIRLFVIGYKETIDTHGRKITFTCASDEIFGTIGVIGTTRLDSADTTLKVAMASGATAATFRTTDVKEIWDTAAPPFDVLIAGQRNTVTAVGAASLVSGAYDQAVTLTRGVNGVTKALAAGEPIRLATEYGRLGL